MAETRKTDTNEIDQKEIEQEKTISSEQPNTPAISTGTGVGYSGTIRVKVKRGKTTISNKTYHNTGTVNLFEFIANVLAGRYTEVKENRPQKLMLFKADDAESPAEDTLNYWTQGYQVLSNPILYTTTADVKPITVKQTIEGQEQDVKVGYKAILHFMIPGTLFTFTEGTGSYCKAALYDAAGEVPTNTNKDTRYAHFSFVKKNDDDELEFDSTTVSRNDTIFIDWELNIDNK